MDSKKSGFIITFSPVHIGDGEEYLPFEYIVEDQKVKIYPFDYLSSQIYKKYSGKELEQRLALFKEFAKNGFKQTLKEFFKLAKIELEPKYVIENKGFNILRNVKTFIKNVEGPYIPGTEVKGAIRTAVLYRILKENKKERNYLISLTKEKINKFNKTFDNKKRKEILNSIAEELEIRIFRNGEKNAQYDIFKSLQVADSEIIPYEKLYIEEIKVIGSSKDIIEPYELIKAGEKIKTNIFINKNLIFGLEKSLGFQKKENPYLQFLNFEWIKEACFMFYKKVLEEDENYVRKIKEIELREKLLNSLSRIKENFLRYEKENKLIIFPLRLGKHQGFLSLTVNLILKEFAKDLYEALYEKVVPHKSIESNKTRKITAYTNKFLGWCFLVIKNNP